MRMVRFFMASLLWFSTALMLPGGAAWAADKPVYTALFSNVAVGGYDAVAYFTDGKPAKGDNKYALSHAGATWHFATAANRDAFAANPARYAPQYGGYCAWAVAEGKTASGDPQFWKIVDGRLYLNYDADIQKRWETDIAGFIRKADKNWPAVLGK